MLSLVAPSYTIILMFKIPPSPVYGQYFYLGCLQTMGNVCNMLLGWPLAFFWA